MSQLLTLAHARKTQRHQPLDGDRGLCWSWAVETVRTADWVAMGGGGGGQRVCTVVKRSQGSPRVLGARRAMRGPTLGAALAQVSIDGELSWGAHFQGFCGGAAEQIKECGVR